MGNQPTTARSECGTPQSTTVSTSRGGIDVFDSLWVRQEIKPGETDALTDWLATWARSHPDGDLQTLLRVDEVTLCTLFLDRCTEGPDGLLWYLEVADDDAEPWGDPATAIREASPLFDAGLDDYLTGAAAVHADGIEGHQLLTHATHPRRQQRYLDHVDGLLVAPVAGDSLGIELAVARVQLKPGLTSRVVSGGVRVGDWLKQSSERLSAWLREETQTIEAEAMYTESILFEPTPAGLVCWYYMETESMERLYDAYEDSTSWEVVFSDWVMRRIFEQPQRVVEYPLETECEPLVHAVHPDRP